MRILSEFQVDTENSRRAYIPGDIIRGELYISLDKPVSLQSIKVYFCGEGSGNWLLQTLSSDDESINTSEKDKSVLVNIGLLVFGYANTNGDKKSETHNYGRYVYTFEFNIPKNVPPSFKSPAENDLGFAKYYLMAVLSRPKKKDRITKQTIIVNDLIDPDQPHLQFQPGSYQEINVSTACVSNGKLNMESYLNQSSYYQGENILINAVAENDSSKVMKEIYAKLIRRVRCKSRFGVNTYSSEEASIHGDRVPANDSVIWKDKIMRVPTVGSTISGNEHDIRVDYIVRIGMFEDMGSEIHLDLPVAIGTLLKQDVSETDGNDRIEDEVFTRDKENYSLQLVKAGDRGKYREALKERIMNDPILKSASENISQKTSGEIPELTADHIKNFPSNKENVLDDEINIALSEDDGIGNNQTSEQNIVEVSPYNKDDHTTPKSHQTKRQSLSQVRDKGKSDETLTGKASEFASPNNKKQQISKRPTKKGTKHEGKFPSAEIHPKHSAKNENSFMNKGDDPVAISRNISLTLPTTNEGLVNGYEVEADPEKFDEDVLVSQSEDQLHAGVDEEAFLEALGSEINGNKTVGKYRNIEESPIIPSERLDEHSAMNEEEFLKEFEKMEDIFKAEDTFQPEHILPSEDHTEDARDSQDGRTSDKDLSSVRTVDVYDESNNAPESSQQSQYQNNIEDLKGRTKQENPRESSEALDPEGNNSDNSQSQLKPWGIVGMIGRLLGRRKKQQQHTTSGDDERKGAPETNENDDLKDREKSPKAVAQYHKDSDKNGPIVEGDFKNEAVVSKDDGDHGGIYPSELQTQQSVKEGRRGNEKSSRAPEISNEERIQKHANMQESIPDGKDDFYVKNPDDESNQISEKSSNKYTPIDKEHGEPQDDRTREIADERTYSDQEFSENEKPSRGLIGASTTAPSSAAKRHSTEKQKEKKPWDATDGEKSRKKYPSIQKEENAKKKKTKSDGNVLKDFEDKRGAQRDEKNISLPLKRSTPSKEKLKSNQPSHFADSPFNKMQEKPQDDRTREMADEGTYSDQQFDEDEKPSRGLIGASTTAPSSAAKRYSTEEQKEKKPWDATDEQKPRKRYLLIQKEENAKKNKKNADGNVFKGSEEERVTERDEKSTSIPMKGNTSSKEKPKSRQLSHFADSPFNKNQEKPQDDRTREMADEGTYSDQQFDEDEKPSRGLVGASTKAPSSSSAIGYPTEKQKENKLWEATGEDKSEKKHPSIQKEEKAKKNKTNADGNVLKGSEEERDTERDVKSISLPLKRSTPSKEKPKSGHFADSPFNKMQEKLQDNRTREMVDERTYSDQQFCEDEKISQGLIGVSTTAPSSAAERYSTEKQKEKKPLEATDGEKSRKKYPSIQKEGKAKKKKTKSDENVLKDSEEEGEIERDAKSISLPLKRNTPSKEKSKSRQSSDFVDSFFSSHSSSDSDTGTSKEPVTTADGVWRREDPMGKNLILSKTPKKSSKLNDGHLTNPFSGTAVQHLQFEKRHGYNPKTISKETGGICTKKPKLDNDEIEFTENLVHKRNLSNKIPVSKALESSKDRISPKYTVPSWKTNGHKSILKNTPKREFYAEKLRKDEEPSDERKWICSKAKYLHPRSLSAPAKGVRGRSEEDRATCQKKDVRSRSTTPHKSRKLPVPDQNKMLSLPKVPQKKYKSSDTEEPEATRYHTRLGKSPPDMRSRFSKQQAARNDDAMPSTTNKISTSTVKAESMSDRSYQLPEKKGITSKVVEYDNKGYPMTIQIKSRSARKEASSKLPIKTPKTQSLSKMTSYKTVPSKLPTIPNKSIPVPSKSPYKSTYVSPYRQQVKSRKSTASNSIKRKSRKDEKTKTVTIPKNVLEVEKQLKEGPSTQQTFEPATGVQVGYKQSAQKHEQIGGSFGWKNHYTGEEGVLKTELSPFDIPSMQFGSNNVRPSASTKSNDTAMSKKTQTKNQTFYSDKILGSKRTGLTKSKERGSKKLVHEQLITQHMRERREQILPYVGYIERLDQSRSQEDIKELLDELSNNESIKKNQYNLNPPYAIERSTLGKSRESDNAGISMEEISQQRVQKDTDDTQNEECFVEEEEEGTKNADNDVDNLILPAVCEAGGINGTCDKKVLSSTYTSEDGKEGDSFVLVAPPRPPNEECFVGEEVTKETGNEVDNLILPTICEKRSGNGTSDEKVLAVTCKSENGNEGRSFSLVAPPQPQLDTSDSLDEIPNTSKSQTVTQNSVEQNPDNCKKWWVDASVQRQERVIIPVNYFPITRSQSPTKYTRKRILSDAKRERLNEQVKTRPRSTSPKKTTKTYGQIRSRSMSPPKYERSLMKRKTTQSLSKTGKETSVTSSKIGEIACDSIKQNAKTSNIYTAENKSLFPEERMSKVFDQNTSLNLSHDDKMVLGGGLIFNSQKKSLKSPRSKKKTSSEPYYKKSRINDHLLEKENKTSCITKSKYIPPRSRPRNLLDHELVQSSTDCKLESFSQEKQGLATNSGLKVESGSERPYENIANDLNRYGSELRSSKGTSKQSQIKLKQPLITHDIRSLKDNRTQIKQNLSADQLRETRSVPKSVIHPSSRISYNTYNAMYEERHNNWFERPSEFEESHRSTFTHQKRTKDDSCDSFEFHEKDFGIIDQHGRLIIQNSSPVASYESRNRRKSKDNRKIVESLLDDLMMIKHKRQASCPAAIGERESLYEIIGQKKVDEMAETKIYETGKRNNETSPGKSSNKVYNNNVSTYSWKPSRRDEYKQYNTNLGQFGYEEEVIETYQFTEERKSR